jgi:hypothetical protein
MPAWTAVPALPSGEKNGPLRGQVSRGYEMVGKSGKAIEDAVPPARTTKEVTLFVEESEGHTTVAAS